MKSLRRAAVLSLVTLSACGPAPTKKTVFFVRIERGNAVGDIVRIDLSVDGKVTPVTNPDGAALSLPLTREVPLPDDQSGPVIVTATAVSPDDGELATARTSGGIVPGETITLELEFGVDLQITPTEQSFGSVVLGQESEARAFIVTNNGASTTGALTVSLSGKTANSFSILTNTCDAELPAGDNCTITVVMRPTAAGGRSAQLNVSASPGGSARVLISGVGQGSKPALLAADATMATFDTAVGQRSGAFTWTIKNTGDVPTGALSTNKAVVDTGEKDPFNLIDGCDGNTLAAGASCTIAVEFVALSTSSRTMVVGVTAATGGMVLLAATGQGR
ncbi:MAG: choice-of-anchor D domain-containing protein [Deltaproteobacteria bacterium]|nr:choice-of-anchor D domain-containing protein [Deltaproteobacteria bacterium]